MSERRYYIVPGVEDKEEVDGEVVVSLRPDVPSGLAFAMTNKCGRGCFAGLVAGDLDAPMFGVDVFAADFAGLTEEQLHDLLPVEMPEGVSQEDVNEAAEKAGLTPIDVSNFQRHKAGGV